MHLARNRNRSALAIFRASISHLCTFRMIYTSTYSSVFDRRARECGISAYISGPNLGPKLANGCVAYLNGDHQDSQFSQGPTIISTISFSRSISMYSTSPDNGIYFKFDIPNQASRQFPAYYKLSLLPSAFLPSSFLLRSFHYECTRLFHKTPRL